LKGEKGIESKRGSGVDRDIERQRKRERERVYVSGLRYYKKSSK